MNLNESIKIMTNEMIFVLADSKPTIYLFGSAALDDFQLGWSDIDILVLTNCEITEQQAETLVRLRQALLERYPGSPYFRLFEGGMLSANAFLQDRKERTVYWGTSGQRITDGYKMDSFGMAELLDSGILLYGEDIRSKMTYPAYSQMRDDIARHVQAVRKYGNSVGWLLDIARGIYTLRTGKIVAKTAAGEWALDEGPCPDADILQKAVQIRKEPLHYILAITQYLRSLLPNTACQKSYLKCVFVNGVFTCKESIEEEFQGFIHSIFFTHSGLLLLFNNALL